MEFLWTLDPAPYWANLFQYFLESKYVQELICNGSPRAHKFHGTSRFIDDFCTINDDGKLKIKQLELKLEHQGEDATFLDLDIIIGDNIFVYKLFAKRNKFHFFIVRMPYLSSNIPSSIFYDSIFSEFLQIVRCTRRLTDFVPKASHSYARMIIQCGNNTSILRQIKKSFQRYPETFSKYCKTYDELINEIIMY